LALSDLRLEGIDLGGIALLGLEFRRCDLSYARFAGADLSLAQFVDCNLYRADFRGAVLYTTRFYECNLTKADFRQSYLLGFRLRNADLTKASFDPLPLVGLERKTRADASPGVLRVSLLARLPEPAPNLEKSYRGIRMAGHDRTVVFLREEDSDTRRLIRFAETARYLQIAHKENGYERQARHYYVVERRLRRKAMRGSLGAYLRRLQDFVFGDAVWRYGSSVVRPVISLGLAAITAAAITFVAASGDGGATGLHSAATAQAYSYVGLNSSTAFNYLNVLYFFLTAPAGGSEDHLRGWVKIVFVLYLLAALWLIALTFEASTRRLGSSR
jgi:hypothetical protein